MNNRETPPKPTNEQEKVKVDLSEQIPTFENGDQVHIKIKLFGNDCDLEGTVNFFHSNFYFVDLSEESIVLNGLEQVTDMSVQFYPNNSPSERFCFNYKTKIFKDGDMISCGGEINKIIP